MPVSPPRSIEIALVLALGAGPAGAAPPLPASVPEALRPWSDWVLKGHETETCSVESGSEGPVRRCVWPSRLELDLDGTGGRFSLAVRVEARGPVALPGDGRLWPLDVRLDDGPGLVFAREGKPLLDVAPGAHRIEGRFAWSTLPESLPIPPETALQVLRLNGKEVGEPLRNPPGTLWLARAPAEEARDRLEVRVHRKLMDEVPVKLETRVLLEVAGQSREVLLGALLPPGFAPLALTSPLPARLEPGGQVRLQVRPGSYTLVLTARDTRDAKEAGSYRFEKLEPAGAGAGPVVAQAADETWVFAARPELRLVEVSGVAAIDPQHTELPEPWRRLPAYRLGPGDEIRLVERRRGDAEPPPDQLSLVRRLWLDFDGRGYTVRDQLSGTLSRSARLEMGDETRLGRAALGGVDQLITRLPGSERSGVEIGKRPVDLVAESRLERARGSIPAVGWDHDFQQVSAVLSLPPGWRLAGASGADSVPDTWVGRWNLLELFLVLVTAVAVLRLWGPRWGVVALATLLLVYPEPRAPRWAWIAVVVGEALVRALREGRLARLVRGYRLGARIALVLVAVPFLIQHVRVGLFPSLETGVATTAPGDWAGGVAQQVLVQRKAGVSLPRAPAAAPAQVTGMAIEGAKQEVQLDEERATKLPTWDPRESKASVQTGPGLPGWQWRDVPIAWSGPVKKDQRLRLRLLGPRANLLLAFVRLALVAALVGRLLGLRLPAWRGRTPAAASVSLLLAILAWPAAPARAELPSDAMLEELRRRLLEPPRCLPSCASSGRMALEATPGTLRARIEIDAAAQVAVPLPGSAAHWVPARVLVDGAAAAGLARGADGRLWVALQPGRHQVQLEGPLPDRDAVQIPLPLRPHRVEARLEGWELTGVDENGSPEESLELRRRRQAGGAGEGALEAATLPPFVAVERHLLLDLAWTVETTVRRLSPPGTGVVLEVPLVEGESVTTAGLKVTGEGAGRKVLVTLGPQAGEAAFRSTLEQLGEVRLRAPGGVPWTESWRLEAIPLWHVEPSGIPRVHEPGATGWSWRPWPGEEVSIGVSRPQGVPGQTLTIQSSDLNLRPGLRATDGKLGLAVLSSRGGQHAIELPEGAELQSLSVDGRSQPLRQEGRQVTFPIAPGTQAVALAWREARGMGVRWRTSAVDLKSPSTNATIRVAPPPGRWVLLLRGPRLGPAVLFWSTLVVFLLVAAGLGRVRLTPLGTSSWLLLSLGLTQSPVGLAALVAGWLLALGARRRYPPQGNLRFDVAQVVLALWTLAALVGLFTAIQRGLLGTPEMQIAGNGSSAAWLQWYADRAAGELPRAAVLSVPLFVYRLAMLAWALWLAWSLLGWLRWGFGCFVEGGVWRPVPWSKARRKKGADAPPAAPPGGEAPVP